SRVPRVVAPECRSRRTDSANGWQRSASRAASSAIGTEARRSGRGAPLSAARGWAEPLGGARQPSFARRLALPRERAVIKRAAGNTGLNGELGDRIAQAVRVQQAVEPRVDICVGSLIQVWGADDNDDLATRRACLSVML